MVRYVSSDKRITIMKLILDNTDNLVFLRKARLQRLFEINLIQLVYFIDL